MTVLAPPTPAPAPVRTAHRWAALAVLTVSVLVIQVDNTILNVALPTLVRSLRATSSQLQWIVDAYLLVFGALMLACASLADRYGRKRLFLAGLVVFGGGSLGAAFAGSVTVLVACRAVMGLGAALTMPSTLSIITDIFRDPAERARAIGVWAGTAGLGVAIGPIAGGLLLTRYWWGSVFFVNVPIIVVGVIAALALVPESNNPAAAKPDPVGAVLSVVGLGLVLWAIIEAPSHGWGSPSVVGVGAAGIAVLLVFLAWEARSDHPMLNLGLYRSRRLSAASGSVSLGLFALFGTLFVQTQFLQFCLGYSPLQAGVRILPTALALAATSPLSTLAVKRIGSKLVATMGLLAIAAGLLQMAAVASVTTTYTDVLPGMFLLGIGAGLLMPTAADAVMGSVPQGNAAVGAATMGVSVQVGGALGVAVIGSLLATRYRDDILPTIARHNLPRAVSDAVLGSIGGAMRVADAVGGAAADVLRLVARTAFMNGVELSLTVGAVVAAVGAVVALVALPARPPPPPSSGEPRAR